MSQMLTGLGRCTCFHVMSRHNLYGCRYCDCPAPPPIEDSIRIVAEHLDRSGDHVLAELVRKGKRA